MIDNEKRVEAATKAMYEADPSNQVPWDKVPDVIKGLGRASVRAALAAADAVTAETHWLAPNEITDEEADLALSVTASFLDIPGTALTVNREKFRRRMNRLRERLTAPVESQDGYITPLEHLPLAGPPKGRAGYWMYISTPVSTLMTFDGVLSTVAPDSMQLPGWKSEYALTIKEPTMPVESQDRKAS